MPVIDINNITLDSEIADWVEEILLPPPSILKTTNRPLYAVGSFIFFLRGSAQFPQSEQPAIAIQDLWKIAILVAQQPFINSSFTGTLETYQRRCFEMATARWDGWAQ